MQIKLELANQIKHYRTELHLSQEELADKIYVTRQTISNWETQKSCPDIHSLLLLASVFQISLDQLIKGDIKEMKEIVKEKDPMESKKLNRYSAMYALLLCICIFSFAPLFIFGKIYGVILWILLYAVTLLFALKIEKFKKKHDIHTLKEIIAFTEGKRLDEIEKQVETGKRPYQTFLCVLLSGFLTLLITALLFWLLKSF